MKPPNSSVLYYDPRKIKRYTRLKRIVRLPVKRFSLETDKDEICGTVPVRLMVSIYHISAKYGIRGVGFGHGDFYYYHFIFKNTTDAILFKMRWS